MRYHSLNVIPRSPAVLTCSAALTAPTWHNANICARTNWNAEIWALSFSHVLSTAIERLQKRNSSRQPSLRKGKNVINWQLCWDKLAVAEKKGKRLKRQVTGKHSAWCATDYLQLRRVIECTNTPGYWADHFWLKTTAYSGSPSHSIAWQIIKKSNCQFISD
jgi:hypothetical protein